MVRDENNAGLPLPVRRLLRRVVRLGKITPLLFLQPDRLASLSLLASLVGFAASGQLSIETQKQRKVLASSSDAAFIFSLRRDILIYLSLKPPENCARERQSTVPHEQISF